MVEQSSFWFILTAFESEGVGWALTYRGHIWTPSIHPVPGLNSLRANTQEFSIHGLILHSHVRQLLSVLFGFLPMELD